VAATGMQRPAGLWVPVIKCPGIAVARVYAKIYKYCAQFKLTSFKVQIIFFEK
jgi:hypothetical protein